MIGPPPLDVYEVGSGDGSLARALAARGYRYRATEITSERGDRAETPGLAWAVTDGVNLDRFEAPGSFDALISNQVLEHLHPDDLPTHLRSARALLRPGGRVAFTTPSVLTGPHDISLVLGLDSPAGMHLREYTCGELRAALRRAGFVDVASPLRVPAGLATRLPRPPQPIVSRLYLSYLIALERPLLLLGRRRQRAVARSLRAALFPSNIVLVATAP